MSESGYENSPACRLLATHCAACGRPLVDADSVEAGMGPDCRRRLFGGTESAGRPEANGIVYAIALIVSGRGCPLAEADEVIAVKIVRLRELGFEKLAAKLEHRWITIRIEERGASLAVVMPFSDEAIAEARRIPGRRWDGDAKETIFPISARRAVWALLLRCFPGVTAIGPRGAFKIQPCKAQP